MGNTVKALTAPAGPVKAIVGPWPFSHIKG